MKNTKCAQIKAIEAEEEVEIISVFEFKMNTHDTDCLASNAI